MKKTATSILLAVVLCVGQTPAVHAESPVSTPVPTNIIISEIQTGGASDATEEFVELYNPNDVAVDISSWQLQYRAASGTSSQTWAASSTKVTIAATVIQPHARVVLVHTLANIAGAISMTGGFSGTGGEIRLIQPGLTTIVQDFVGYGTAADSETLPALAPTAGNSIKRKIDMTGAPIDTNNNAADFIANCGNSSPGVDDTSPLPYASGCAEIPPPEPPATTDPEPPATTPPADDSNSDNAQNEPDQTETHPTYLPIKITELLPDPASPYQDNSDEFIELYNPNDTAVTLQNYRLQTGNDYRYSFTLGDTPLGPHMYLAIPSAVSKLSLANSGSGVRLLDPSGNVADEVASYGTAKQGQSWMLDGAGWHWSLSPTPNEANILTVIEPKIAPTPAQTPAKKKAAAAPKLTSTKMTTPKVATPKKPAAAGSSDNTPATQTATANPQYWLLVPIGAIVGGYALYEYRQDIAKIARKGWSAVTNRTQPTTDEE